MKKVDFTKNWAFHKVGNTEKTLVDLPHDAMFHEPRDINNRGGKNVSWFGGGDYVYEKTLEITGEKPDSQFILEFEGVYQHSEVYINDCLVSKRPYGYTNFDIDITDYIDVKKPNFIKVIAKNSNQPNSRWYSGSGIYRPVSLFILPREHIVFNSMKIRTIDIETKTIEIALKTTGNGVVRLDILDKNKIIKSLSVEQDKDLLVNVELPRANLWDLNNPNLYTLKAVFNDDEHEVLFGIREISVSAKTGFCLNRERVILKGGCIHHDNGILGAVGHPYADKRKARIMKEQGFNAIRSAHNPISKAFLDECDRIGLLVLDEYVDMWYVHKTRYDYADYILDWWKQDLLDLVNKDYNHPSVIMYSIGNEVSETSEEKGIQFAKEMNDYLHSLDDRPVTCGVNIFFNYLYSLGFGVYTDKKAEAAHDNPKKTQAVGSEFFNILAGKLGDKTMKIGAWLPGSDRKTKKAFSHLDVAGYNYGILRYKKDFKKYPERVILGTETFAKDARKFMDIAKDYPALIGDFVWAGMDYLGEVGVGAWIPEEITKDHAYGPGWISAGSGRIDLIGNPLSEMAYMRVAFDIDPIRIGVIPVNEYKGKHTPSAWKMTNAMNSWTWPGCEGSKTRVEVYSKAHHVSLFLNGAQIATKKPNRNGVAHFVIVYEPGILKAVGYDKDSQIVSSTQLTSGDKKAMLNMIPEAFPISTEDLAYVRVRLIDKNGIVNPLAKAKVNLDVENGVLIAFGNACSFNMDGYNNPYSDTYYGEALAIIRPIDKGTITIHASSSYGNTVSKIQVE